MKKSSKKRGTNRKFFNILSILLILTALLSIGLIIYFDILPIEYLSIFIVVTILIVLALFKLLNNKKLKIWVKSIFSFISIIFVIIFLMISLYSFGTFSFFSNILDRGIRSDNYSLYVLKDSGYKDVKDLNDLIISVTNKDEEGMSKAIDKLSTKIEFNMAETDTLTESLDSLLSKEVDAIFALDSNMDILLEDNEKYKDLEKIYTVTITTKVKTLDSDKDVSKDNFIIYISGIDITGKVASKARSDVNILVAVNPKDKKILMVNTPRDFYIELPTKKAKDKLTHAGVYGIEESIGALEQLYDINIDYYSRVNFTTFVNIVESLNGITVDVPLSFCEQTSARSSARVCLQKGVQTLNGEQALALARTRHTLQNGDRDRIKNQLLVLNGIMDKAMSPSIIVNYNKLLSSMSNYMLTNIDQKSITKLIKKQIKSNTEWEVKTFTTEGKDQFNTTYSTGSYRVYVMDPDMESVNQAKILFKEIFNKQ